MTIPSSADIRATSWGIYLRSWIDFELLFYRHDGRALHTHARLTAELEISWASHFVVQGVYELVFFSDFSAKCVPVVSGMFGGNIHGGLILLGVPRWV